MPILAIESDGYGNHKAGTRQHKRDELKNSILEKCDIPLIRFSSTGSNEERILRKKLLELV